MKLHTNLFGRRRIFAKPMPITIGHGRAGADALAEVLKRAKHKPKPAK